MHFTQWGDAAGYKHNTKIYSSEIFTVAVWLLVMRDKQFERPDISEQRTQILIRRAVHREILPADSTNNLMKCETLPYSLRYATPHTATNRWANVPQKYYNNRLGMIQQQWGPEADGILPGIRSPAEGQHTLDQSHGECPLLRLHWLHFILAGNGELLAAPSIIFHSLCMPRLYGDGQSGCNKNKL